MASLVCDSERQQKRNTENAGDDSAQKKLSELFVVTRVKSELHNNTRQTNQSINKKSIYGTEMHHTRNKDRSSLCVSLSTCVCVCIFCATFGIHS